MNPLSTMAGNYVVTMTTFRMVTTVTVYSVVENNLTEIGNRTTWVDGFPGYIPITYSIVAQYYDQPMATNQLAAIIIMRV